MNTISQLAIICICFSCNQKGAENSQQSNPKSIPSKTESKSSTISKEALLGVWTDGTGPNATFVLSTDSIEYADSEEVSAYAYDLVNDSIVIHYADHDYQAKVITGKDSLIFEGRDVKAVFTRFKE